MTGIRVIVVPKLQYKSVLKQMIGQNGRTIESGCND